MTNKEENVQNLNTKFKIKVIKKDFPGFGGTPFKIKLGKGIYQQINSQYANKIKYSSQNFSINDLKQVIGDLYSNQNQLKTRKVNLITNQAGIDLFNEAMMKELQKQVKKDEYRKKLDFRSKIFKQTYKFR